MGYLGTICLHLRRVRAAENRADNDGDRLRTAANVGKWEKWEVVENQAQTLISPWHIYIGDVASNPGIYQSRVRRQSVAHVSYGCDIIFGILRSCGYIHPRL